jgi:hypothetical protein
MSSHSSREAGGTGRPEAGLTVLLRVDLLGHLLGCSSGNGGGPGDLTRG